MKEEDYNNLANMAKSPDSADCCMCITLILNLIETAGRDEDINWYRIKGIVNTNGRRLPYPDNMNQKCLGDGRYRANLMLYEKYGVYKEILP